MGESDPDEIEHKEHMNFLGLLPWIHETIIHKDDDTFSACGWDEKEANQKAGEKYRKGEKD